MDKVKNENMFEIVYGKKLNITSNSIWFDFSRTFKVSTCPPNRYFLWEAFLVNLIFMNGVAVASMNIQELKNFSWNAFKMCLNK